MLQRTPYCRSNAFNSHVHSGVLAMEEVISVKEEVESVPATIGRPGAITVFSDRTV